MRAFALILAAMALAVSACSSGSDSSAEEQPGPAQDTTPAPREAHFTKAQLSSLGLKPSDAPEGMRYTKEASGRLTLADAGFIAPSQVKAIQKFKLEGIHDSTFDSTSSDLRLASRIWLFDSAENAQKWLDKTEADSQQFGFEPLDPPSIGEDGWAGIGNLAAQVLTYAFREGNVVVVTSYTSETETLSEAEGIAAARKAQQRLDQA